MKKGFLITIGLLVLIAGSATLWGVGVNNDEIALRNRYIAQEKVIEGFYDKMWKILKQKAGVTDQYKESFKEIYLPLIEGRYSQGDGTLMKWVQEDNPAFDASLYKDLMNSIESERNGFFMVQTQIEDIEREHNNLLMMIPSKFIVGDKEQFNYIPITSASAKEVMETREENDVDLFSND